MTDNKKIHQLLFLFLCLFAFCLTAHAGSASLSLNGNNSVYIGKNVEITVALNNINASNGVAGVQLGLNYDSNVLEYVSSTGLAPFGVSYSDKTKTIAGISINSETNIKGTSGNLIKLVFKTKREGNATIRITNVEITEGNNSVASVGTTSKTISVLPPPSTNANLSSLSVSGAQISFSKDVINYDTKVGTSVTSISINASAEDGGAKVVGIGTKNLNYGNNTFKIVVTAPSGDTKTYTINVNREDTRSSNTNLSSLKIEGVNLNPNFDSKTTNYIASVPFEVENLKVTATAEDSKSKVEIAGQNKLESEKIRNVTVKVTAENGATKTYIIKVTRGKDPNKPLSNNNNLATITASTGTLSPAFNKDVVDYSIYVPVEEDKIDLNAIAEDSVFAQVKMNGPEKLNIGTNKYTFTVTAEDGSTKTYTVTVTREASKVASESTLLKEIKVENGTLTQSFNKEVFVYKYKKGNDVISIEGIAEDGNNKIMYFDQDGVIVIVVEDGVGNSSAYTFIPEEKASVIIPIICTSIAITSAVGGPFLGYKYALIKKNKVKTISKKVEDTKKK